MSCSSPSNFESNQLLKGTTDGSICLYDTPEGMFILVKNEKSKERKVIRLDDVYAGFRNNVELKLEGCPRSQPRNWNPFKTCREVFKLKLFS